MQNKLTAVEAAKISKTLKPEEEEAIKKILEEIRFAAERGEFEIRDYKFGDRHCHSPKKEAVIRELRDLGYSIDLSRYNAHPSDPMWLHIRWRQ